jgi:deferrochelatase/peroxidase EfeB
MNRERRLDPGVDLRDIQGLVRFGFKNHREAVFLLLRVKDPREARAWLARAEVTSAITCDPPPATALQIALTSEGLRALAVPPAIIAGFSDEFIEGMSGDDNRARRLGDVGANDPGAWQWGASDRTPHVAVLLYALPHRLETFRRAIELELQAGFELKLALDTSDLDDSEPFGFRDGISQPELDWGRKRAARDAIHFGYSNLSCLGEYLLGYPNEYGRYTPRPLLDPLHDTDGMLPRAEDAPNLADLGRNGSYLVLRQLRQDIHLFWQTIDRYAGGVAAKRDMLAAAMVGRTLTGEPLVPLLTPAGSVKPSAAAEDLNTFTYDSDAKGMRCPLGAHIRRTNPRNGDFPAQTSGILSKLIRTLGFDTAARHQDLVASTRFHRLLRRGREYGDAVTLEQALDGASHPTETGLHFICLNASIQRQFEFVQNAWIMSTKFNGMRDESDPLLGNRAVDYTGGRTDSFFIPQTDGPAHCLTGLPQFVTVRGGAYFFLPGIRALRFLAKP